MTLDDYDTSGKIGEGTYGVVFKATKRRTGEEFAIKRFKRFRDEGGISPSAIREIKLLRELHNPRIVELTEVEFDSQRRLHLVYRWAEHDLSEIIKWHEKKRQPMKEARAKSIMWQMIDAVCHMNENGIMHRDLKPANVLITSGNCTLQPGQVKLADLGLARVFDQPLRAFTQCDPVVVTMWYRAPELLLGSRHHTCAIDTWALGCIFAEMARSRALFQGKEKVAEKGEPSPPFQGDQMQRIFLLLGKPTPTTWRNHHLYPDWKNAEGLPGSQHSGLSTHFQGHSWMGPQGKAHRLLEKLLRLDPNNRITAAEALKDRYFETEPKQRENNIFGTEQDPYEHRTPEAYDSSTEDLPPDAKRKKVEEKVEEKVEG